MDPIAAQNANRIRIISIGATVSCNLPGYKSTLASCLSYFYKYLALNRYILLSRSSSFDLKFQMYSIMFVADFQGTYVHVSRFMSRQTLDR